MAISSSTTPLPAASLNSQMRVQQAQRNAERAELQARSLQFSARAAQATADRAQEGARNLQVQSDLAQGSAVQARQGVLALRSAAEARTELGIRAERAVESLGRRDAVTSPATSPAVVARVPVAEVSTPPAAAARTTINSDGQTTGLLISVQA